MAEDTNKIMYKEGDYVIGMYDDFNFFVGKESVLQSGKKKGTKVYKNMRYFSTMDRAILGFAKAKSGEMATSLREYVDTYADTTEKLLETAFEAFRSSRVSLKS